MWIDNDKIMNIFDNANKGEKPFPCNCPVCNNHSAHIYIHKNNDKHCGIWTWCSSCNSYSHMSGETPLWWKNPDFVDENKLCSEPEYLDKMADNIDAWVNSIIPTDSKVKNDPFVMEDRFKVKLTEEFQDIPVGTIGTLIIKNDFKTMIIDFADEAGKITNIDITPEKVTSVFEVIN